MITFEDHMNIRIEHSAKTLRSKAEMLKQNMEKLIKNIDGGNLSAVNTLGEVQGLGREIDLHCMELKTLLYSIDLLKSVGFDVEDGEGKVDCTDVK